MNEFIDKLIATYNIKNLSKARIKKFYTGEISLNILSNNHKQFIKKFSDKFELDSKKLENYYIYTLKTDIQKPNKKKEKKLKPLNFENTHLDKYLNLICSNSDLEDIIINNKQYKIHQNTKLILTEGVVIGKYDGNKISELTKSDVYLAKEYNFDFKIPFNLGLDIKDEKYEKDIENLMVELENKGLIDFNDDDDFLI